LGKSSVNHLKILIVENRFFEMNKYLGQLPGSKTGGAGANGGNSADGGANQFTGASSMSGWSSAQAAWAGSFSAGDRALLVLIENGGVDLGIPDLVDKLIDALPGSSIIGDSLRKQIVDFIRTKLKSISGDILENAELFLNRYSSAKPDFYSEVTILRAGSATYQELKDNLIRLSQARKITDVLILTHGGKDSIWVKGSISGNDIRGIKTANGGPLTIRSVYMMNCVGSSMNQAWLDAGARASAGTIGNNYLPEPTTFFFWSNWKAGQTFENAVIGAYRKTIAVMNEALRSFISSLPFPGSSLVANAIDLENFDFVKESAPVVQGQRTLNISSDDLNFAQSLSSSLATTVIPVQDLRRLAGSLSGDKVDDFVKDNYAAAQATEKSSGIPAVAVLAQAALESGWGKSAPGNNFFGIKSSDPKEKRQLGKTFEVVQNDKLTPAQVGLDSIDKIEPVTIDGKNFFKYTGKAWFRAYDTAEDSFTDHANFLKVNSRYKKAIAAAADLDKFFDELQAAGYAQAPDYAKQLKSIARTIKQHIPTATTAAPAQSGSAQPPTPQPPAKSQSWSFDVATHNWVLSDQGVDLIKDFEGYFSKMYNDPVGHCTIGYGTLLHKGNCNGDTSEQPFASGVSKEEATKLLKKEAEKYEKVLNDNVAVDLSQNQVDSLISFVYNVGPEAFRQSTMLKLLNQQKYVDAKGEFGKWNKARQNGKLIELPGLTKRRKAEAELFGK
jgi:flagellum-specific peptidoglycan hydrolase FlgJ/GH24 family phage-related lysozyme (muramidase)